MKGKQVPVAVILVNYNSWEDTTECVRSLLKSKFILGFDIYIVDNHSPNSAFSKLVAWCSGELASPTPDSKELAYLSTPSAELPFTIIQKSRRLNVFQSGESRIFLIQASLNGGFAYGNNLAVQYATNESTYEFYWFLNNDTVVLPDTLFSLYSQCDDNVILGAKVGYYYRPEIVQCLGGGTLIRATASSREVGEGRNMREDLAPKIDYVSGACMFISSKVLEILGPMNEEYFLYFEELDWAQNAKRKSISMKMAPEAIVYHKNGQTINVKGKKSKISEFYYTRNKLVFTYRQLGGLWAFIVLLSFPLIILNRIRKKEWDMIPVVVDAFRKGIHHIRKK